MWESDPAVITGISGAIIAGLILVYGWLRGLR